MSQKIDKSEPLTLGVNFINAKHQHLNPKKTCLNAKKVALKCQKKNLAFNEIDAIMLKDFNVLLIKPMHSPYLMTFHK